MGSRTPANTIGFTVQHPGGKVLNISGMKQGDAEKQCTLTKPQMNRG